MDLLTISLFQRRKAWHSVESAPESAASFPKLGLLA